MKTTIAIAALCIALGATSAEARETGIINQAGPYEATMQFYLHPAHGFPGEADASVPAATAIAKAEPAPAATKKASKVAKHTVKSAADSRPGSALVPTHYTSQPANP